MGGEGMSVVYFGTRYYVALAAFNVFLSGSAGTCHELLNRNS